MKNEGPFILEWLAWHKSIGITSFVVFTNDCTDGTDDILNRLDELGYLRHLPNPALALDSPHLQNTALNYTPFLREWQAADFFISMDVDEFINIRVGKGKLTDLMKAVGEFDALSMSELNHGSNNHTTYSPGLMTEQFPRHQLIEPNSPDEKRGVKTIVRLSKKLKSARNHRPVFRTRAGEVRWLDGSGQPVNSLHDDPKLKALTAKGRYNLVSLDHFSLRSLDSYLIKMQRGRVSVKWGDVSKRYWRTRNRNEELSSTFGRQQKDFRAALDKLMSDVQLSRLHNAACAHHAKTAASLYDQPGFMERRAWILEDAWDSGEGWI